MLAEEHEAHVGEVLRVCREGQEEQLLHILHMGLVEVDDHDDDDVTPLQTAAAAGHVHLVKILLKCGADVNLCNQFGWTPVIHAVYNGHLPVVNYLVNSGANVKQRTYLGASSLTLASSRGNLRMVKFLLDCGVDETFSGDVDVDLTPVMAAAVHGQDTVDKHLLSCGADVNSTIQETGLTALMLAAMFGHVTTVQLLLDCAADPNATTLFGHSAMTLAITSNKNETRDLLQSKTHSSKGSEKDNMNIMEAVEAGSFAKAREILRQEPSQANFVHPESGKTPLMTAATLGRFDLVETLLTHKAKINVQETRSGFTALMFAIAHEKPGIAKFLIASGADINIKDNEERTVFDIASQANAGKELLSLLGQKTGLTHYESIQTRVKKESHAQQRIQMTKALPALYKKVAKRVKELHSLGGRRGGPSQREQEYLSRAYRRSTVSHCLTWDERLFADPLLKGGDVFVSLDSVLNDYKPPAKAQELLKGRTGLGSSTVAVLVEGAEEECPRSLAAANAARLGPGRKEKWSRVQSGFKSSSTLNLLSSGGSGSLPREFASYQLGRGPNYLRSMKGGGAHLSNSRPHSYHDPGHTDRRFLLPVGYPRRPLHPSSRPHSYHDNDPHHPLPQHSQHHLPLTPTRKSFGFFSLSPHLSFNELSKGSSSSVDDGESSNSGERDRRESSNSGERDRRESSKSGERDRRERGLKEMVPEDGSIPEEIQEYLNSVALQHYSSVFEEQEIDVETFLTLTDEDLREMGIEEEGPREAILLSAKELSQKYVDDKTHFMHF